MPELPEVEVSRRGLLPHLTGKTIVEAKVRAPRLRRDIPANLGRLLPGLRVAAIERRGKYLLFDCENGVLLLHLGMSGSLRLVAPGTAAGKHDHFDLVFAESVLRLRDPRRFGLLDWIDGDLAAALASHPLLTVLGIEPLEPEFDGDWLYRATRGRRAPVKQVLMDSHVVVGVGNIYAAESLFRAGISPLLPAERLSRPRCRKLAEAVKETLREAIAVGGSSVRDYVHSDGGMGGFQLSCAVYGREGEACRACGGTIRSVRLGGRASCYCPHCQR